MKNIDFVRLARNPWLFKLFLFQQLPLAWMAGLKINHIDKQRSDIGLKYSFWSKNPFRSIYFAALCMAGEFASGVLFLIHVMEQKVKVSMLVVQLNAQFTKKAVGKISFTCDEGDLIKEKIDETVKTGEGVTFDATTIAKDEEGDEVARFTITWSAKAKTSKDKN